MHARILPLEHCPQNQLLSHEMHWIRARNTVLPSGLNSQYPYNIHKPHWVTWASRLETKSLAWLIPQGRRFHPEHFDIFTANTSKYYMYYQYIVFPPLFPSGTLVTCLLLYESTVSCFHVSSPVRQPWYIKGSPHCHQSSAEEDSPLSRNNENKVYLISHLAVYSLKCLLQNADCPCNYMDSLVHGH